MNVIAGRNVLLTSGLDRRVSDWYSPPPPPGTHTILPVVPAVPHCTRPAEPDSACQSHSYACNTTQANNNPCKGVWPSQDHGWPSQAHAGSPAAVYSKQSAWRDEAGQHAIAPSVCRVAFMFGLLNPPVVCCEPYPHAWLQHHQRPLLHVLQQQYVTGTVGTQRLQSLERSRRPVMTDVMIDGVNMFSKTNAMPLRVEHLSAGHARIVHWAVLSPCRQLLHCNTSY